MSKTIIKGATAKTVETYAQENYGKTYNQLNMAEKATLATNLTTMITETNWINLLENVKDDRFGIFFADDLPYGAGEKLWTQDLLVASIYDDTNRYPTDFNTTPDKEVIITDRVQIKVRYDINEVIMLQYFPTAEKMATYLNNVQKRAYDTLDATMQQFFYLVLTNLAMTIPDTKLSGQITPIATKIQGTMLNKQTFTVTTAETDPEILRQETLKAMVQQINLDIKLATEKVNKKDAFNNDNSFYLKPSKDDLVLVINQQDLIDIDIYVKAGLFNAELLELPNITRIEMSSNPVGTYMLFDKRFLRVRKNYSGNVAWPLDPETLEVIAALHYWFYVGAVPFVFGKIKTIETKAPTPPKLTNV